MSPATANLERRAERTLPINSGRGERFARDAWLGIKIVNKYKVKVYVATAWSLFTQADHYEEYEFESNESLEVIARRLAREGFRTNNGKRWVMPGAILEVNAA